MSISQGSQFPQLSESISRAIATKSCEFPADADYTAVRSKPQIPERYENRFETAVSLRDLVDSGVEQVERNGHFTQAADGSEIASILGQLGLTAIAKRVNEIAGLNHDDPENEPLEIKSLKACAAFLVGAPDLQVPRIGVSPDGLLVADWRLPDQGILALMFMPDQSIRYSASAESARRSGARQTASGTLDVLDVRYELGTYFAQLQQ